jgi:hypothetical protein
MTLRDEYREGEKAISELVQYLPSHATKIYLYGNHEDRFNRFMADMQNAKNPLLSPKEGLKLDQKGFLTIEDYNQGLITLGNHLDVIHGVYYSTHCAKAHIDKLRGSVVFAHTHRIQSFIEGEVGGFNIGWGGDANSAAFRYANRAMKSSWQNGFAEAIIDTDQSYHLNQIVCYKDHFFYNGKKY